MVRDYVPALLISKVSSGVSETSFLGVFFRNHVVSGVFKPAVITVDGDLARIMFSHNIFFFLVAFVRWSRWVLRAKLGVFCSFTSLLFSFLGCFQLLFSSDSSVRIKPCFMCDDVRCFNSLDGDCLG